MITPTRPGRFSGSIIGLFLAIQAFLASIVDPPAANAQPGHPPPEYTVSKNVRIPTRHGVSLSANVFLPKRPGPYPVLMAATPYNKDKTFPYGGLFEGGQIAVSKDAPFEGPDPEYWTHHGYAVVIVDTIGHGQSGGDSAVMSAYEAQAYYDAIEWAGTQRWSNGRVGLNGVSYLAMSQWHVASMGPPHLKAIMPVEGLSDLYRDAAYHGGIPETGFVGRWAKYRLEANKNPKAQFRVNILEGLKQHPTYDAFWKDLTPDLGKITVPAYVVASWSDQGLHTRGTLLAFEQLASDRKWLEIHGRKKWEFYYGRDFLERQRRFFDHFLKDADNGMPGVPRLRYERRLRFYEGETHHGQAWPLPETRFQPFYLLDGGKLGMAAQERPGAGSYAATERVPLTFVHRFERDTEITGPMKLKLWVETDSGDDIDLFVGIGKLDRSGNEVPFAGYDEIENGHAASGWLRVSQREQDTALTKPYRPFLKHQAGRAVRPNEAIEVDVEILPASTFFQAGETIAVRIQGQELSGSGEFERGTPVNAGRHTIRFGGETPSFLLLPVVER